MTHVDFAHPYWLGLGALACLGAVVLMARAARLRRRAGRLLAGLHAVITVSRWRRRLRAALVVLGTACVFVALARPRWGFRWETEHQSGADLMFAVDTSKSMETRDVLPDRLTRAKLAVTDLLRQFPGARAGLIAFAGTAFVQAPMTLDHAMFAEALDALDTSVIPRGGTNLASAIRAAVMAMASEPDHRKVLVILSDGENLEGDALVAASQAAKAGLVIYTVGVGTPGGQLIPGAVRDGAGQPVRSRLDEPMLRQLAAATGGAYAALGPSGRGLEALYQQHLAGLPRRTADERTNKVWTERFALPLAIGLGCLLLELVIGERRRARRSGAMTAVAAALLMGLASRADAADLAGTPTTTYNDGTTAYRKQDFSAAEGRFKESTRTTNLGLQEDAYYDLGNARYRLGQAALAKGNDRPAAIAAWKDALAAYDGALALQPKDGDARFNRDLVARRLAALEQDQQKQNQQKQNQQKQNQQKQDQQKQDQGRSKDQSQKSRGSKDQRGQSGGSPQASQGNPHSDGQKGQGGAPQDQGTPQKNGQGQQQAGQGASAGDQPGGQPAKSTPGAGNGAQAASAGNEKNDQGRDGQALNGAAQPQAGGGPQGPRGTATPTPPPATPAPHGPGAISSAADAPGGQQQEAPDARREPGGLTRSEAVQLLDSVSGELRRMPATGNNHAQARAEEAPEKDW